MAQGRWHFPYARVMAAPWCDDNLHGEGERMKLGIFSMPSHPPERSLKDGHEWDLQNIIWADELGFEEFWIGEHHAMVWEPHPSPDLLVVEGFRQTKHIRIGPGGFCLPYHHPAELANEVAACVSNGSRQARDLLPNRHDATLLSFIADQKQPRPIAWA